MKSYNANCYISNDGNEYHMECKMMLDGQELYTDYTGKSLSDGLDIMVADLIKQSSKAKQEKIEETPEEKIARLESQIAQLQEENMVLKEAGQNNQSKKYDCKNYNTTSYKDNYFDDVLDDWFSVLLKGEHK